MTDDDDNCRYTAHMTWATPPRVCIIDYVQTLMKSERGKDFFFPSVTGSSLEKFHVSVPDEDLPSVMKTAFAKNLCRLLVSVYNIVSF